LSCNGTGEIGVGRSRRKEHQMLHHYIDKNGKPAERMGLTFDAFLKTKLVGVLASLLIRLNSPWRRVYDGYKHRLESDPNRIRVTTAEWKKRFAKGENVNMLWPPGRINNAAKRYMVKMFLQDLWETWRKMEGLPVGPRPVSYAEDKLGMPPHRTREAPPEQLNAS
jgi:hypothetical protein